VPTPVGNSTDIGFYEARAGGVECKCLHASPPLFICLAGLRATGRIHPSFEGLGVASPRTGDAIRTVVALPETTLAVASA
jgi:hypothetical protein